ncbi:MAG: phosphoglycerate mutase [Chitinophagaceae bacterium]|nr:phosphoglycerate mutase [Chitinophagaceae bacterium]
MKLIKQLFILFVFITAGFTSFSQATTIILVRHAEKAAPTPNMQNSDPDLSDAGKQRANNLVTALKDYKADVLYSTNYTRTKTTLAPLAAKLNKTVEVYDPSKLADFAAALKQQTGKTIVVAGHSNTTPQLANLLIGEKKYEDLNDAVYNKIWIITVENGKVTDKVIEY